MFLNEIERVETIAACRFCPMCNIADGVAQLTCRESNSPRGRGAILFALEQGLLQWDECVAEIMFRTINDGLLREWCVGRYDHEELVIDARSRLVRNGLAPEEVRRYLDAARRETGAESLPATLRSAGVRIDPAAECVLYAGRFVAREALDAFIAAGRLFNCAGIPFNVLDSEPDSGFDFYMLGDFQGAREASVRLSEALRRAGCKTLVTLDSTCFRMITTRTERFGGDLSGIAVRYYTSDLADWLRQGLIVVPQRVDARVTYHDPSSLCRYADEMEEPRRALRAFAADIVEMRAHGRLASTDGADGMLAILDSDLARQLAARRLGQARETGARILVTPCPRSAAMLKSAGHDDLPQVACLVEFAAAATKHS